MTVELTRHLEAKPIRDTCEAIAFLFSDRLEPAICEQLACADDELVHTLWNLIELRPRETESGQLTIAATIPDRQTGAPHAA